MRVVQPVGTRGSLKWIQRAIDARPNVFDPLILAAVPGAEHIEWLSPLANDGHAEYRDSHFLERIGHPELAPALAAFWPARGPQWDALARTDDGDVLLVEAKARIGEMLSSGTSGGSGFPAPDRVCTREHDQRAWCEAVDPLDRRALPDRKSNRLLAVLDRPANCSPARVRVLRRGYRHRRLAEPRRMARRPPRYAAHVGIAETPSIAQSYRPCLRTRRTVCLNHPCGCTCLAIGDVRVAATSAGGPFGERRDQVRSPPCPPCRKST